jgi:hypothetical protein
MTVAGRGSLILYLALEGFFLAELILVILTSVGCATSLVPMALQAGGMAGAGLLKAAEPKSSDDGAQDSAENEERCDELELQVPGTIEFRLADQNPSAWRQLQLGGSSDSPQWQALASEQSDAAGWRPLSKLENMSFAPPLEQVLKAGKRNYLAYAPAEPRSPVERDQLVALTADFGVGIGTVRWNGRTYQYTLVNRLPCFPGPVVVARQNRG